MPLLRFSRQRRSFPFIPAAFMPAAFSAMPPIDTRQIERAVERGRARMESIAETISNETMGELLEDLRQEAAPIAARAMPIIERAAERATGRRRKSRKPKVALAVLALMAIAGVVAYLFWQRRDEEPAYLTRTPDQPDLTPAQTPPTAPAAPSAGPSADPSVPEVPDAPADETPAAPASDPTPPVREYAGTPHAIFGLGDRDALEERPVEGNRALPSAPRASFTPAPVQLPSNTRRSWLPR
jgi:hypothetical protein